MMIFKRLKKIDDKRPFEYASLHCDIPYMIYDHSAVKLAVLNMIRTVDLLDEFKGKNLFNLEQQATFIRLVNVKEAINILWSDYMKETQLASDNELQTLTAEITPIDSVAKQPITPPAALTLLDKISTFADVFWQTKVVRVFGENNENKITRKSE